MIHLIKAELYQLAIRRTPKLWLIVGFLIGAMVPLIYYLGTWVEKGTRPVLAQLPAEPVTYLAFIPIMTGTALFLMIGLGNTAYHDETQNRTLINSVSAGHSRTSIYLVKFLSSFLLAILFLLVTILGFSIAGSIIFNGDISLYFDIIIKDTLPDYLPIWVMNLALFQLVYFFSTSNALMNITIITIIASPLIWQLLSLKFDLIQKIEPFIFTQLNPSRPIMINQLNFTPWLALIYFLIFMELGIIIFSRREIK
ncbi:ABC transporter permease [Aerococcaceae bacterium WGS1372]